MLPSSLLTTSHGHQILVELKNGETYNGHLTNSDGRMNLNLRGVYCTSREGDRFWKIPHIYIRGALIKYLRLEDEVLGQVKEDALEQKRERQRANRGNSRGGRGGDRDRGDRGDREKGPGAGRGKSDKPRDGQGRGDGGRGRGRGDGGRGRGDGGRGRGKPKK